MQIHRFEKLPVWKRSMDLVVAVHRFTLLLPADEKSLLAASMRRTATSIPARIAQGASPQGPQAMIEALAAVHGYLRELRTQLLIAERLRYVGWFRTSAVLRRIARTAAAAQRLQKDLEAAAGLEQPNDAAPPPLPMHRAA